MVDTLMELFELESRKQLAKVLAGGVAGACVMFSVCFMYGILALLID